MEERQRWDMLVPRESGYGHYEGNSDSPVKTSLLGLGVCVCVNEGLPVLGVWQSIYFCEFDGRKHQRTGVSVIGE